MIKRTLALAISHNFDLSAARGTLVVVSFAVRVAHRLIVLRTNTRTYDINKIHGINAASWHDASHAALGVWDRTLNYEHYNICGENYHCDLTQSPIAHDRTYF